MRSLIGKLLDIAAWAPPVIYWLAALAARTREDKSAVSLGAWALMFAATLAMALHRALRNGIVNPFNALPNGGYSRKDDAGPYWFCIAMAAAFLAAAMGFAALFLQQVIRAIAVAA